MGLKVFFDWLLYASMAGSLIVALLLLVKIFLKNILSTKVQYLLWFILIFKLVMPEVPGGLLPDAINLLPSHIFEQRVTKNSEVDKSSRFNDEAHKSLFEMPQDYALEISDNSMKVPFKWLFLIWLLGFSLLTVYTITINYRFLKAIHRNKKVITDEPLLSVFESCKQTLRIRNNRLGLFQIQAFRSPGIIGFFRPCLLLPSNIIEKMTMEQIRHVFLHELIHYKRKDILINGLLCVLQLLHWFNPVIWYAFFCMRADREISCDYMVMENLKEEDTKQYGVTLIDMLKMTRPTNKVILVSGFSEHKTFIKHRIYKIATFSKYKRKGWQVFFAMMLFAGTLTIGAKSFEEEERALQINELSGTVVVEDLKNYFTGYKGSFVLLDDQAEIYHIYNEEAAVKRSSPASTFKIFAALMALESNTLTDENEIVKWDGTQYPFKAWNEDQKLSTAMANSVNWFFEGLLLKMDRAILQNYMNEITYGNQDLSGGVAALWGKSDLKISPLEQVNILKAFYDETIPFSKENIDIVKEVIVISDDTKGTLSGKTGTIILDGQYSNGWFIGYVEIKQRVYFFATYIEAERNADGKTAKAITFGILKSLGLY